MHENTTVWKTGYMPLIVGGIGAMASALFMPWVSVASPAVGQVTRIGVQTRDGRLFAIGLVLLAVLAWNEGRAPRETTRTALLVGALVMAAALVIEFQDLTRLVANLDAGFSDARLEFGVVGMGIGLTAFSTGIVKRRSLAARAIEQPLTESFPSSPL